MPRRVWRCPKCGVSLGVILPSGMLSLDRATAAHLTKHGAAEQIECRYCHWVKAWYGKIKG